MAGALQFRRLIPADRDGLRALRLQALETEPSAFGKSVEEEAAEPMIHFDRWIDNAYIAGAFDGPRLVGTASIGQQKRRKHRHVWDLGAVYVSPAYRGQGAAIKLMTLALEHVRQDAALCVLTVNAANTHAITLYERFGFKVYGRLNRSIFDNGVYHDELLMVHEILRNSN